MYIFNAIQDCLPHRITRLFYFDIIYRLNLACLKLSKLGMINFQNLFYCFRQIGTYCIAIYVQVTFGYRVFRYSDELSRGCQVCCQAFC